MKRCGITDVAASACDALAACERVAVWLAHTKLADRKAHRY